MQCYPLLSSLVGIGTGIRVETVSSAFFAPSPPGRWDEKPTAIPRLAKKFILIAVGLRGVGCLAATPGEPPENLPPAPLQIRGSTRWIHPFPHVARQRRRF